MAIPLLMDPAVVGVIISPLKRLQSTQARELERFLLKPLVINQDVVLSPTQIKVFHIDLIYIIDLESTDVPDAKKRRIQCDHRLARTVLL